MTKLTEIDGAKVRRVTDELAELMRVCFPTPVPESYSKAERAAFAKAAADFAGHAAMVLACLPENRVAEFSLALLAAQRGRYLARDDIERRSQDLVSLGTRKARSKKDAHSKTIDGLIWYHANQAWTKNPKLKGSASGTAKRIAGDVNAALAANGLEPLGPQAIRKRVQKLK